MGLGEAWPEDAGLGELEAEEPEPQEAEEEAAAALASAGVTPGELAACASVLQRLAAARGSVDWGSPALRELRKALAPHLGEAAARLPQKDQLDAKARGKFERKCKREHKQRQQEADQRWRENAQLRTSRLAQLEALTAPPPGADVGRRALPRIPDGPVPDRPGAAEQTRAIEAGAAENSGDDGGAEPRGGRTAPEGAAQYERQQACYICKARFSEVHHFYSHLCPQCAALNFSKRHSAADMTGRVCLVTGARVKIGFATCLKLLRMGARVIATTRFPADAARRYRAESDSAEWSDRLAIRGVDFRFLGAVEAFCKDLLGTEPWLDVLVNNACQTVRRPAAYYQHLLEFEAQAGAQPALAAGGPGLQGLEAGPAGRSLEPGAVKEEHTALHAAGPCSSALSQLAVLPEDRMPSPDAALVLPEGERDAHGQQLDTRSTNSWLLKLGEVDTPEAVEVFCINALTPFILNSRLRPLLERSPHADRYIVNVSAMEGKFYRWKQPTHPHTNMAKAALNMMTRTSADDLARNSGIFMNAVDTGWINDENPLPTAQRIAQEHGFQTPIDEVDAAARILDPVVLGVRAASSGEEDGCRAPLSGCFLKDYGPTEW